MYFLISDVFICRNNKNGSDNESFAVLTVQKYLHFESSSFSDIFTEVFFLFFDVLSAFQSLMILFSEPIIHLCTLCEVVY